MTDLFEAYEDPVGTGDATDDHSLYEQCSGRMIENGQLIPTRITGLFIGLKGKLAEFNSKDCAGI